MNTPFELTTSDLILYTNLLYADAETMLKLARCDSEDKQAYLALAKDRQALASRIKVEVDRRQNAAVAAYEKDLAQRSPNKGV